MHTNRRVFGSTRFWSAKGLAARCEIGTSSRRVPGHGRARLPAPQAWLSVEERDHLWALLPMLVVAGLLRLALITAVFDHPERFLTYACLAVGMWTARGNAGA